jgi:hypothetical protein
MPKICSSWRISAPQLKNSMARLARDNISLFGERRVAEGFESTASARLTVRISDLVFGGLSDLWVDGEKVERGGAIGGALLSATEGKEAGGAVGEGADEPRFHRECGRVLRESGLEASASK